MDPKRSTKRCSTCSRVKPLPEFDGKATCLDCRLRKRKSAEQAKIRRRGDESRLVEENEKLRAMLAEQLHEATQWQSEAQRLSVLVSRHQLEIRQLRTELSVVLSQQGEPGFSVAQPSMYNLQAFCTSASQPNSISITHQQPPIENAIRYTSPDAASVYTQGYDGTVANNGEQLALLDAVFDVYTATIPDLLEDSLMSSSLPLAGYGQGSGMQQQTPEEGACEDTSSMSDLQPCRQVNEKAIIAEMVQTASKIHKVTTEAFEPWLLYFHNEAVSQAFESRQVVSASNIGVISAILVVLCCVLRLSRVALGIELAFGAYGTMQIGMVLLDMLVHLGILCCAFCIRKSRLSHVRLIQALVAVSCITSAIILHLVATQVLSSNQCAPVEMWICCTMLGFLLPTLAMQASAPVYVHSLVGVIILQPVLVSPHIESGVRSTLFICLVVMSGCNYQAERARRQTFVHELELISERSELELECKLAHSSAKNIRLEEKIRDTELLFLNTKLENEGLRNESMQTTQFDAHIAHEEDANTNHARMRRSSRTRTRRSCSCDP